MKIRFLLCICSFYTLSEAYSQKVLSLHPIFSEQDAVLIPEIEGLWNVPDFDMTVSFQKAGDNFYLLRYGNEANPSTFEVFFVKLGNVLFLDLSGVLPDTLGDSDYRNTFITVHSLYKIQMNNKTMNLSEISYRWFYNFAMKNNSSLKYEWVSNAMLLTLSTDELQSFFIEQINKHEIFENPLELTRNDRDLKEKSALSKQDNNLKAPGSFMQNCMPEFPFQDGWLGGDGDVSVPVNETTTLFLFSDTYVGSKNQRTRNEPGMKMVSNSVAVETCLPNGGIEVRYFWNNMYAENPEPIFRTNTRRYNYWVPGAFMINENLYVQLEKVGPKSGASPGEIFNFSLLGYTLAKISNPAEAPDKWKIEYIPLPDFVNPLMSIGPQVLMGNHVYYFVSRNDKAQVLVRKQAEYIDDINKPYEYYSLNKKWEEGLDTNDMDTIVNGFRGTTVNYHPEIKKWVMICDIKFMDNKIKMRTATELTGPWSEEINIYEIPEVTPGNSSYSKSNFCYLPRECIQNYDSVSHTMLITYDINNSNFSEILSNPKIYTPRVITIPLN